MINYLRSKIQEYKKYKFYSKFINKGDLCFDIGANVGSKSKIFLSLGAKVLAIEPQKSCETVLQKIKSKFKSFDYRCCGTASDNGLKILYRSNIDELSTFSKSFVEFASKNSKVNYEEQIEIETYTLDYLIKEYGLPKYCKIDVEGYETEVLKGLSYRIDYIEFELINEMLHNSITCIQYLSALDSNVRFNVFRNESEGLLFRDWPLSIAFIERLENLSSMISHANIIARFK